MRSDKSNIVVEKSFRVALKGIEFCNELRKSDHRVSDQLFRSITSIGANIHEAQNAESLKDFIHKLKISSKELDESMYWMRLCEESEFLIHNQVLDDLLKELVLILSKIISTSKKRLNK